VSNAEPNFTGGGSVFGWLVAQWRTFLGSKVDASNGYADGLTLIDPIINGFPVPSSFVTAATEPLSISAGNISIGLASTFAVVADDLDFANENANLILAGPGSGSAAKPTFRALVAADIPSSIGVSTFNGRAGVVVPTGADYSAFTRGYIAGLTLSYYSAGTLLIAAGVANDSASAIIMSLGAFSKTTAGAWTAGSDTPGMGNGLTIANNTWYHVFLIINAGSADVYFDTSLTAANAPSSTTAYRRIGSFLTNGSAQIIEFVQNGDEFLWFTPPGDVNTSISTAPVLFNLSVPPGVVVNALFFCQMLNSSGAWQGFIFSPATAGTPGLGALSNVANAPASGYFNIRTDTSRRILTAASVAATGIVIYTAGWIDSRGRNN
jgi:hypothetical protein